jgi:hypothetical protein
MKNFKIVALAIFTLVLLAGCNTESTVVSSNLSEDADNFKVQRKITFMNTVTDQVLYTVEGNFSIVADTADNQLEITAKTGSNEYQKHFLGLSPTTVYIVEQKDWVEANKYQFKITVKPSTLIPDIDVK